MLSLAALAALAALQERGDYADGPRGLGAIPLEPPLYGSWPFQGHPHTVSLDGATFARARWKWPLYSGVVEQYREAVPTYSRHLLVFRDGSFLVGHVDEANPDQGRVLEHAILDARLEVTTALAIGGFAIGLVGGLLLL